jgi:hypothetical protein
LRRFTEPSIALRRDLASDTLTSMSRPAIAATAARPSGSRFPATPRTFRANDDTA